MRWVRRLGLSALLAAAIAAALTSEGGTLKSILKVGELPRIDFATLERTSKPNQYVVCPPGLCNTKVDTESPAFDVPIDSLRAAWHQVAIAEPRVELLGEDSERQVFDYVQRSRLVRYPDIITVQFLAAGDGGSTLAIYSRSIYGRSDFSVNRNRITDWLAKLQSKLGA